MEEIWQMPRHTDIHVQWMISEVEATFTYSLGPNSVHALLSAESPVTVLLFDDSVVGCAALPPNLTSDADAPPSASIHARAMFVREGARVWRRGVRRGHAPRRRGVAALFSPNARNHTDGLTPA
mmetsp:Transcript_45487/g.107373  ORF Transcript_45487/g.107373 Transcript_45487/m.107373 type:complete len:124 (+) Transcript_45487:129-500(+)